MMKMGDTVLLEDQVNPVMSVALENGLEVTAIHNHMTMETPRIIFLHFWGVGKTTDLAKGLKTALATQNLK